MYLLSLYFDKETEGLLQKHIERVAVKTGNLYMLDNRIPPHITIASCRDIQENKFIAEMDRLSEIWKQGIVDWVSIGSFKPHVLFVTPVLNAYLYELCVSVNKIIDQNCEIQTPSRYQPFEWLPHTTIARTLTEEQMLKGFRVLQANFEPFSGRVVKVGLAQSKPYRDVRIWELGKK